MPDVFLPCLNKDDDDDDEEDDVEDEESDEEYRDDVVREGGGRGTVLPYMGYMCDPKGYGFSAVLVRNRVSILADFDHFGHK